MQKTVLISLPLEDLQTVIIDCVTSCLKNNTQGNTANQQAPDHWLDLNELCKYLPDKPAKATVYGWVHTGVIPCHKGAKKLRFLKSEIDAWLMQGRKKTLTDTASEADNYLKKKRGKA